MASRLQPGDGSAGGGRQSKAEAWMRAHPKGVVIAGAGAAVGGLLLWKSRSSSSSAAAPSSASSSTPAEVVPGFADPYANQTQLDDIEGQLNTLSNDLQNKAPSSGSSSGKTPATVTGEGTNIVNIPASTKHAPIVEAVAAPGGGVWYLGKDGGVFAEGGAKFQGSFPGLPAATRGKGRTFVSLIPTSGGGYSEIDSAGEVYHFGPAATTPGKGTK